MESLNNKIDGAGGAQGSLPAAEWNQIPSELQNTITQTGQTLTSADVNQVGKAIAAYTATGDFYTDSGAANAYSLVGDGSKQTPPFYEDGLSVRFIPANSNTSASTINVAGLGIKSLKRIDGVDLIGGEIIASEIAIAFYDLANDWFLLLPSLTPTKQVELKSGRKNLIINGDFDIWQRGTSFVDTNGGLTADRWRGDHINTGGNGTISRVAFVTGQTDVPNNPTYYYNFIQSVAFGTGIISFIRQRIEDVRNLAGQTATLSFYAKSTLATTFSVDLTQVFGTGGSPSAAIQIFFANINPSSNWQKFVFTFPVPSIAGKTIGTNEDSYTQLNFNATPGLFNFDLAQVQLEKGPRSTEFEFRHPEEELALCQRYYWALNLSANADLTVGSGYATSTTVARIFLPFPVELRATPSVSTLGTAATFLILYAATTAAVSAIAAVTFDKSRVRLDCTVPAVLTVGHGLLLKTGATTSQIVFDAEL